MNQPVHSFDVSLEEAKRIQSELRGLVDLSDAIRDMDEIGLVGGADVAFLIAPDDPHSLVHTHSDHDRPLAEGSRRPRFNMRQASHALAGIVVLDRRSGEVVETVCATMPVMMPYIPGFLSFREGPAILRALGELSHTPEVMVYDGCGIAHPRELGIASHLAVLTGIPSVGCAKSRLCGVCDEPDPERGRWTDIVFHDRIVGACLRTKTNVKPVFVSPGSGFSIDSARALVLSLATGYRLPEATRLAHRLVTRTKQGLNGT